MDQVVAESWEGGVRGTVLGDIDYQIGVFHTINKDDIIFTSTGGVGSNEGFFQNIGKTRRIGTELGLLGAWKDLDWSINYSFVDATFETGFQAASANHPLADANGEITVQEGDRIPGIPQHTLKIGGDYYVSPKLSVGGNLLYNSDQFLRGDEANLLETVDGYAIVNIYGNYQVNQHFSLFARINNLFDNDYETFGLLGEPDEVFPAFTDARFLGPGAPISGFIGIKIMI